VPSDDAILAILSSGIALAGLLLIFSGFLIAKAESYDTRRGDTYKRLARGTLVPVLSSLALSWMSADALEGSAWAGYHLLTALKIQLGITAAFAIIGLVAVAS
jgi:hypothetical protein